MSIYSKPAITVNEASELLDLSHQATSSLIKRLIDDNVLVEVTGYQRNRIYFFIRYLGLFSD